MRSIRKMDCVLGVLIVWLMAVIAGYAIKANCSACIGQFCGSTMECPHGCFCAKEIGGATGRCLGD